MERFDLTHIALGINRFLYRFICFCVGDLWSIEAINDDIQPLRKLDDQLGVSVQLSVFLLLEVKIFIKFFSQRLYIDIRLALLLAQYRNEVR